MDVKGVGEYGQVAGVFSRSGGVEASEELQVSCVGGAEELLVWNWVDLGGSHCSQLSFQGQIGDAGAFRGALRYALAPRRGS